MPNLRLSDFFINNGIDRIKSYVRLSGNNLIVNTLGSYNIFEENNRIVYKERIRIDSFNQTLEERNQTFSEMDGYTALDHSVTIFAPSQQDDDESSFNYSLYLNDSFSYYNIKNEDYEDITIFSNEKELPNFLIGALYSQDQGPEQESLYTMLNSIPSLIDSKMLVEVTEINNYEFDSDFVDMDNGMYSYEYENRVDYFKHLVMSSSVIRDNYSDANTNLFVDYNYTANDSKLISNVPFFNKIRLPFHSYESDICDAFNNSEFSDRLLFSFYQSDFSFRNFSVGSSQISVKIFDLIDHIENFDISDDLRTPENLFLRYKTKRHSYDHNSMVWDSNKNDLMGFLNQKITENILNFDQLIGQQTDHLYEHLGYKIEKYLSDSSSPIQTFYFLNTPALQDFVDTQIKFEQAYEYKVIAIFAIYGSEYSYENFNYGSETADFIEFDFVNRSSLKVAEVELTSHTMRVVEPPPIPPEVTFYNEKNKKNMLKIRLEHQDGNIVDEYSKKPLRPFNGNEEYISRLVDYFKTDNVLQTSGKSSDGIYEIYKLDTAPSSYSDFEDGFLTTVGSEVVYSNGEKSKSVMFKDKIKHQQKYYYTFRTLTHRGNASELSPIFVVEMYEDADETFMTYDVYEIPKISSRTKFKEMRKYIQIIPNEEHIVINEEDLLANHPSSAEVAKNYIVFGEDDLQENLFEFNNENKYIKLRLESENSGRKMDINLFFKKKESTN